MTITDEGAETLIGLIGEQAAKDYKRSYKKRLRYLDQRNINGAVAHETRMNEIERFFKGKLFKALFPRIDGALLFEALERQAAAEYRAELLKPKKKKKKKKREG